MEAINSKLSQDLLRMYARRAAERGGEIRERTLSAGEFLIRQGETPQEVFLLLQGRVKVYHTTLRGNEYLMAILGAGELLGEVEILTGEPQLCSVKILQRSQVAVIPRNAYQQWLRDDNDFALAVNQVLCYRLQKAGTRAAMHLSYPLEYSLLRLFKKLAEEEPADALKLSKTEIADYLGTSVRSINRILKKLQDQRVIRAGKNEIRLLSLPVLETLMDEFER